MACSVSAQLAPRQARAGDLVTLTAWVTPEGAASAVRAVVVGYGFEQVLTPGGGAWRLQTPVPYEAQPMTYELDVYAVDASGGRCGETRVAFTVVE